MAKQTNRYHISKDGKVSVCQAKKQMCPLGGESAHFSSKQAAEEEAEKRAEKKYGGKKLFTDDNYEQIENTESRKKKKKKKNVPKYVPEYLKKIKANENFDDSIILDPLKSKFVKNLRSSEVYTKELPEVKMSFHAKVEREERRKAMAELAGEGKVIKRFLVNDGRRDKYIHEVRDNGVITVYSTEGIMITTMPAKAIKIKALYVKANEPLPEGLLKRSQENYELNNLREKKKKEKPKYINIPKRYKNRK